jgi:hypothetical protein
MIDYEVLVLEKKKRPGNPDYYVGLTDKGKNEMEREINKCKGENKPKSCYDDEWEADKAKYRKKRKNSKKRSKKREGIELSVDVLFERVLERLLVGELSASVEKKLKNLADRKGYTLASVKAEYRKGLAAWSTGHRPGVPQHAWAMARVNSASPSKKWSCVKKKSGEKK